MHQAGLSLVPDRAALARARTRAQLQTWASVLAVGLIAAYAGLAFAGVPGLLVAGGIAAFGMLAGAAPADLVLRRVLGARRLEAAECPVLPALAAELAARAGLAAAPSLYLLPWPVLQAMATGSEQDAAIAFTPALAEALPPRQFAAVLAHEVAHVRNGDLFLMRLAASIARVTRAMVNAAILLAFAGLLSAAFGSPPAVMHIPLVLLAAPLVSDLLLLSVSRRREFLADAGAVELTGDPQAMAGALVTLLRLQGDDFERLGTRTPGWLSLLRTHPTVEERIAALGAIAAPARPPLPQWQGAPWVAAAPAVRPVRYVNPWRR
jgi:heat shock protein HtpX